ncbi:MAG: hypothetical protein ACJ75G_04820 [Gaiellaceae bacterium]
MSFPPFGGPRHERIAPEVPVLLRTRLGISVDGFIATTDGIPVFAVMPDFEPHESYGWPFSLPGTPRRRLRLEEHHAFRDGTIRHVYALA